VLKEKEKTNGSESRKEEQEQEGKVGRGEGKIGKIVIVTSTTVLFFPTAGMGSGGCIEF
jgi:hypothetical protein